jgi:hypothetical protein
LYFSERSNPSVNKKPSKPKRAISKRGKKTVGRSKMY